MKKLFKISLLAAVVLSFSSIAPLILPTAEAALGESTLQMTAGKRCEKCYRGDDGKMVCEPVPCP